MKTKFGMFLTVCLLCLTVLATAVAADSAPRLVDGADLLTEAEERSVLDRLNSVSEQHQVELVIVTVDSMDGLSAEDYANVYFDEHRYGLGENRDGVLLLVSMEYRDWYILTNGLGTAAVNADDVDYIGQSVADYLGDGDYADAFHEFIDESEYEINGEINGFPFLVWENLLIALVVGLVLALIVTGTMRAQLKSVKRQQTANSYVKNGSMQITAANEIFLYRTVNRREKAPPPTTSGGSRGSSFSGSSRGGGGGKF